VAFADRKRPNVRRTLSIFIFFLNIGVNVHRYKKEASSLIKLATPVLIASVAQTGMGFVDTVMAGVCLVLDY